MSTSTLAKPSASNRSWIETVPAQSGRKADGSKHATVLSWFEVAQGREQIWTETWQALGGIALSRPECRGFRILRDRKDPARFLVLSEWQDAGSFHRFIRETSILWLDRVMPGLCLASEFSIVEAIPPDQSSFGDTGS